MESVKLNEAPPYEAMSYHWGGRANLMACKDILINKKTFHTTNSAYALLYARSSFWRSCVRWVDAICINQSLNEEKSQQVKFMSEIYKRAERVVVWHGDRYDSGVASAM